jgi:amidase
MATFDDACCYLTIAEMGHRLRDRTISSTALTGAFLDRIHRLDGHYRSYARLMAERALAEAAQADEALDRGLDRGPLHGIPVAIKDLIASKGIITAAGMTIRAGHIPDEDATVLERLRQSGAVVLGKLNLTEGATLVHHPSIEAPRNPWNPGRDAGFSSSGSGVAVAAGLCAAALGSDTGGSIRVPSSYNGVTGLKPTWGRVSRHGVFPLVEYLDTIGPMARSAAGAAAILSAIAGADPRDATAERIAVPNYVAELGEGVGGVAIGVDWAAIEQDCDDAVVTGLRHAAEVLQDQGARIREITLPSADIQAMMVLGVAGMANVHRATYPARADEYGPAIRQLLDLGLATSAIDLAAAINVANDFRGRLRALFDDVDLILAPATATVARPAGAIEAEMGGEPDAVPRILRFTMPFNVSGSPTITFPSGFSERLPTAAQIVAPHFAESLLLRAGHAFQSNTDWHLHQPPFPGAPA